MIGALKSNLKEPKTVEAILLPGWMTDEQVIKTFVEECVDPKCDEKKAIQIRDEYRTRIENSPERLALAPKNQELTANEKRAADSFLKIQRQAQNKNVADVIKIDPSFCVAHQLQIILDRSEEYKKQASNLQSKLQMSLPPAPPARQMQVLAGTNEIRIPVPHAEFMLGVGPTGLGVAEMAKHITVSAYDNRLLLWAGYHRSLAAISVANPEGIERSLVVVLTYDAALLVSPDSPNPGIREMLRGLRPPLLMDFLDDRFSMRVKLRKKRCELWVQGRIMWLDDES